MSDPAAPYDKSLPEHPDAIRRRLRDEKKWSEAEKKFRRIRQTYYNHFGCGKDGEGLTESQSTESNWAGWMAVLEDYPSPPGAVPLPSVREWLKKSRKVQKKEELPELTEEEEARFESLGESDDHAGEVIWVYNQLENYLVSALDCPSRGAWTMLGLGRKDKGWFFEKMYRPVAQQLSKQKASSEDGTYHQSRAEKLAVEELRQMLKEAVAESQALKS